jgi:hypothetical protein
MELKAWKNEVRLAYVLNLDALNAAMDCLEKHEEYPGRTIAKIKYSRSEIIIVQIISAQHLFDLF